MNDEPPGAAPTRPIAATYRLQVSPDFGLDDAAAVVPYLAELGVTHVYTSPFLQATAGSAHGYDAVDPTAVNAELGGAAAHRRFVDALGEHGLGSVIDVVPNHLAADPVDNPWWRDVLRLGEGSRYAGFFDIDWVAGDGKIVLPVLGRPLADEVGDGAVSVRAGEEWVVETSGGHYPLDPATVPADGTVPEGSALLELLARQHYVLVDWQGGADELNYRRFFDVSQLVGVRVEDPDVFAETHRLVLQWVADGVVDGLRIDHPDGLADPVGYLHRLREHAPDSWILVEKILVGDERLPDDWPVDGTTGYDALAVLTNVLVDPDGEPSLTRVYERAIGRHQRYGDLTRATRLQVMDELLVPEITRAGRALVRAAEHGHDGRRADLSEALAAVTAFLAEMPVYRTYTWPARPVADTDREIIDETGREALRHHPGVSPELIEVLTATLADSGRQALADELADLARIVQQTSGPVMAKGVEDTALYRFTRFVALNDVGCEPDHVGLSVDGFHREAAERAEHWPRAMVTTSTHDTKRSEDVRARLAVLSELADEWAGWTGDWLERGAQLWPSTAPRDPAVELLLHQTLVGSYPLEPDRLHAYLTKSTREAKRRTRWLEADETFEGAVHEFVDVLLANEEYASQLEDWWHWLLVPGRINSLTQKLLALTMPGVPDVYQGTELWALDLVDPDNRRAVDYDARRELLAGRIASIGDDRLDGRALAATLDDPADPGTAKLAVVHAALAARREYAACFVGDTATYAPLLAEGPAAEHVVAFARGDGVVVAVPRLGLRRERDGGWRDTTLSLPPGVWDHAFHTTTVTGPVRVADLLDPFPVALLVRA